MDMREKVIKGLECCTQHGSMSGRNCNGHWGYTDASHTRMELIGEYRAGCTYGSCETGCVKTLAKNALALLKEDERAIKFQSDRLDALLKAQEPVEANCEHRCNKCKFYEGVHNVMGHAPCSFWEISGVMWNDYCSRFNLWNEGEV